VQTTSKRWDDYAVSSSAIAGDR